MRAVSILLVAIAVGIVGAATWYMSERNNTSQNASATALGVEGRMPSLERATTWLNSAPLTDADLRGKVMLIDFWTYTCINWRRQLPYVRAWAEKYKDKGLIVIGVHTPEFEFEKNVDNVRLAVKNTRVDYPVVLDSDYSIWNAFNNRYWPALYFVDAQGNIRHSQFGEGEYEQSERIIQQLLGEAGSNGFDRDPVSVDGQGAEAEADWQDLYSPENYTNSDRTRGFSSPGGLDINKSRAYEFASRLDLNHWALAGNWTVDHRAATLNTAPGSVRYRFHARDLHLVMGPAAAGAPIKFRISIDGQLPGNAHGVDVDEQGNGAVVEPRMYQLIRQAKPISDRTIEIEFFDPGIAIFSFTFG